MEKWDTNFLCEGYFIKDTGHQHKLFRFHPVHWRHIRIFLCHVNDPVQMALYLGPLIHPLPAAEEGGSGAGDVFGSYQGVACSPTWLAREKNISLKPKSYIDWKSKSAGLAGFLPMPLYYDSIVNI